MKIEVEKIIKEAVENLLNSDKEKFSTLENVSFRISREKPVAIRDAR